MALWTADWLSHVKTWMREHGHGTEVDEKLTQLIDSTVALAEQQYLASYWQKKTRTERPVFRRGDRTLSLRGFPVSEVVSLKYDPDRGFGTTIDEVATADYYLDTDAGQIVFDERIEATKAGTIQVIYKGGLATSFADLKSRYPHLVQGITLWCADWYDRQARLVSGKAKKGQGAAPDPNTPPPAALALLTTGVRVRS